jgi:3-hydroxymyristoyl/3-hydroxydecanoyl-(acyl carrier protein) dehydratase
LRDAKPWREPRAGLASATPFPRELLLPRGAFPTAPLAMVDELLELDLGGGPAGLGYARGRKWIDPSEWFFAAHFHGDPVMPGSLGLEAFLQLATALARRAWPEASLARLEAPAIGTEHVWRYRGQVLPTDRAVVVEASVRRRDDAARTLTVDGYLAVDGRVIYEMLGFTVALAR